MDKRTYGKWLLNEASDPSKWDRGDEFTIKHLPSGGELWLANWPIDTTWWEHCGGGMAPVPFMYRWALRRAIRRMMRARAMSPTPEPQ